MAIINRYLVLCLLVMVAGCANSNNSEWPRWYKGNLHTHSLWSDGDQFPELIAEWYRSHDYDFLGISDHNTRQQGEKWMKLAEIRKRGAVSALDKYLRRYRSVAQTRGDRETGTFEVRLRPFDEYRADVERPGKFLMIPAEEISDKFEKKPIHINATNLAETIQPQGGKSVVEVIQRNLRAIAEQSEKTGRPILPHLNHPNFGYGVTAEELAEVVEEPFFEVYNGHPSVNQLGDKDHIPVERIWDVANTLRIAQFKAPPLMGLATDDSHHYHVVGMSRSAPGRGWVMVKAEQLTAESLIEAMRRGDFYASSGVELRDVRYSEQTRTIEIDIASDGGARFTTQFIGTMAGSSEVGKVLATVEGEHPRYTLTGDELYVRAIVNSDKPAKNPSLPDQKKQAWTQPVGWRKWIAPVTVERKESRPEATR